MIDRDDTTARASLIEACLLGGAIGDSLGADIEFASLALIRWRFPQGFDGLPPHDGIAGAITDDTQMTLFTAEGLIRAIVRYEERGICHPPSVIHHALLRWLFSQGEVPNVKVDDAGLICDRRLHARRALRSAVAGGCAMANCSACTLTLSTVTRRASTVTTS